MLTFDSVCGPVHTVPFLLVSVSVASSLPIHIAPFCERTVGKISVLSVHVNPTDCKNAANGNLFCAFTSLHFSEAHCRIFQCSPKSLFLCIVTFDNVSNTSIFVALLCRSL